jgi:RimJ/RimL family protein N-acetyltransferase
MALQPSLKTQRFLLRPFAAEDASPLATLANDPSIAAASLDMPNPLDGASAEQWILSLTDAWNRRCAAAFAVTRDPVPLIGAVTLLIDAHERSAEIGYWVGVPYRRRGVCTEAVQAVVTFGLNALALQRITASHDPANEASRRIAARVGMHCMGVLDNLEVHVIHRRAP